MKYDFVFSRISIRKKLIDDENNNNNSVKLFLFNINSLNGGKF